MLLLNTKLHIPPLHSTQVLRPHLVERLEALWHPEHTLALVAAPAGFGKTTLVSEWIAQQPSVVAWVSLDAGDNDPVRFWDYVIAALQTLQPQLGVDTLALLHEPQPLPFEAILTTLINELNTLPDRVILVLDDYHVIETETIHKAVIFLLDNLPEQIRLIITARVDPPLPLGRMRARNQLVELRAADLRFVQGEVAGFLTNVTGLKLDNDAIQALETRTEGWAAGLQLAALAMRGQQDVPAFIKMFSGDHRYILDYLGEEVLDRQPEPAQQFLLRTSILERLNSNLCEVLTDQPNCQAVLEMLERGNFFTFGLDDQRHWYRYHQLFGDFLRLRLRQKYPQLEAELHRRASLWFEQKGLLIEAVNHALASQDFVQAARLVEKTADLLIWQRAELSTLLNWLNALPDEVMSVRPRLCLYHGWVLYLINRMDAAEQRIQDAENALRSGQGADDALANGMVATLHSTVTGIRQQFAVAMAYSRQALDLLPETSISWRCVAAINLGVSCAAIGDLSEAVEMLHYAMELSQEIGSSFAMLSAFWHVSSLQATQLRLNEAQQVCHRLIRFAQTPGLQRFPVQGYIALLLGEIALERNQLHEADRYLSESASQINAEGFSLALLRTYVALARTRLALNDPEGAALALERAEQLEITGKLKSRATPLAAYRARRWVEQGDYDNAARWVQENALSPDDDFGYHRESQYLVFARLLLAQAKQRYPNGQLDSAAHLLDRMIARAETTGRTGSLIRALTLKAMALDQKGETLPALETLARALVLAEPEGCIRTFVDEMPHMGILLPRVFEAIRRKQITAWQISADYAGALLAALGQNAAQALPHKAALMPLGEALSEREREVLRLLAEGMSSDEIAARLVIAVGTARKHIKNIYGKLDVHNRLEAARRAQELGLI